ncbi:MAG: FAD binding domain-containing protein [Acidobacteria bacterium]|nr:FAD binding domain-containing protein [Acidobacteriota bacterium]
MEFLVNGRTVIAERIAAHETLLDYLRGQGLTGAKEGCAEGECGACTVAMVKPCGEGSAFVPVNSCLMLLGMAAGQEIYTVEGLARGGKLAPVQQAMVDHGGSQCGYCTPGFVMSLFAEHYRPGRTGPCDPHAMGGNLCRCTGYRPIRDAALSLGAAPEDEFSARLRRPGPAVDAFEQNGFARPATMGALFDLMAEHPEARFTAGGTDLVVENNLRGKRFERLISLEALAELRVFRETDDAVEIGAGLTLSEIEATWAGSPAVIGEWLALFASPLIRNRATLGGNLATASPIGDAAPLLLAMDASMRLASRSGERLVPLDEFFLGYRKTVLGAGEVIVSIVVPKPFAERLRFYKVAKRRMDDISTVAAAFALRLDASGVVKAARFAFGGVAATPVRVAKAEAAVTGRRWNDDAVVAAQTAIMETLRPLSDHRGSAAYRLAMARNLVEKFA